MLSLNYRDARPIYEQVKDGLRHLVVTGAIQAGDKLPSVRALASSLAINPNTIQRAYEALEREGYLCTVAGKGSFAAERGRHQHRPAGRPAAAVRRRSVGAPLSGAHPRGAGRPASGGQGKGDAGMIEVQNVVKTFEGFRALDGLTMTVPDGSIYGLVGPNGAGKSTILRHITGIYRQDEGKVLVAGEPVYENPAVKARMASIPDELYYFLSASTRDMMRFYRGFYPRFDPKRYEALKDIFTLVDEKQPIRRLSKGMQKQSAFWLSLCCRPDLLVLDEPVDGLDPVMRRQVWSLLMSDVAEHGTTVLVSSHNLRELEDVCDHVGILSHGRVLVERGLSDLQENVVKMQVVFQEKELPKLPDDLEVLHVSQVGRIHTLIIRGNATEVTNRLAVYAPILMDALPLTLEEIFIYELGGEDYEVRDIVL